VKGGFRSCCLFPTALGTAGIAWNERGVTRLQLREAVAAHAQDLLLQGMQGAVAVKKPEPWMSRLIERVQAHLDGQPQDFTRVALDLGAASPFDQAVYEATRAIPPGVTKTFGEMGRAIGMPHAARAVGQALRRNPVRLIVPCHRVIAAGSKPAPSRSLSMEERILLLELFWSRSGSDGQKAV
jgi:methylated-DNA-[protein]-cysteine S-methyltransferase